MGNPTFNFINSKVGICKTENKGYGVFALQDIFKGEVIERTPVLLIPASFDYDILDSNIGNYMFEWENDDMALALGYGSFYNHSYTPNASYDLVYENNLIIFTAITHITQNDEIVVNYNGTSNDKSTVWFEVFS